MFPKRRSFLKGLGLTAAAAGAGVTLRLTAPANGPALPALSRLGRHEAKILAACYASITGDATEEGARAAATKIDAIAGTLAKRSRFELWAALFFIEQSPLFLLGYFARFTSLAPGQRAECLNALRLGSPKLRPVFNAIKEMSYLAYYTDPAHWAEIGYTGPMVGDSGAPGPFDTKYLAFVARAGDGP